MKTTTVSKLKASLSKYLRSVKAGEEVLVTERGRPIAKLTPAESSEMLRDDLLKWKNRVSSSSVQESYRRVFGNSRDPTIPRDWLLKRCCGNGRRAGEVLGHLGDCPSTGNRAKHRNRQINSDGRFVGCRLVGNKDRMCLSSQSANPRWKLAYRRRTPGTSGVATTCQRLE